MNLVRLVCAMAIFVLTSCASKDAPKSEAGIAVSTTDASVAPGVYRSEKITQTSFRDYSVKETVFSEVKLEVAR